MEKVVHVFIKDEQDSSVHKGMCSWCLGDKPGIHYMFK